MERIDTPTADFDKFGPGKNGFQVGGPPSSTQLSSVWFDSVQEEIARAIEDQGIVLDPLQLDQLTQALNSWSWSGTPTVKAGAELVLETGAPGGRIRCESGSEVEFESGSTLTGDPGSTCTWNGDMTIGGTGSLTVNAPATFNNTLIANGIVSLLAGANLADQEIEGAAGSRVDVETLECLQLEFDDAALALPTTARSVRYNETTLTVQESDAVVRSIAAPDYGYQASFTTPNAIDTTGAVAQRRMLETEPVWLEVTFDYLHTSGLLGTLNTRIQVAGPVTIDIDIRAHLLPASGGVQWRSKSMIFEWRPVDDFVGPGTFGYSFTVRAGSNLGADLELRNIGIKATSAINV